jgi:ABC-type transport system involved in cytochrome c biogenesis permease subunit
MSSDQVDKTDDKKPIDAAQETDPSEKFEIEPSQPSSYGPAAKEIVQLVLKRLSSLKLTVTLFAFSLVLVLAGTVAQAIPGNDINEVVNKYFRVWFTWIDVYSFHPLFRGIIDLSGVSPKIGIWFPGGFLIGSLMGTNLVAAHSLKFRVQAKGVRLASGSVMLLLGVVTTCLVVESGHAARGQALAASITWDGLWTSIKVLSVLLCGLNGYALQHFHANKKKVEFYLLCGSMFLLVCFVSFLYFGDVERLANPSMRILWQLGKSLIAAVTLLIGCILLFKKRAGVVLLHSGIALMMVNEVVVHVCHVETRMTMFEGDTVNFAEDIRESEFVLVNSSDKDFDEVISFKGTHLEHAAQENIKLTDEKLPFDIKVLQYFTNSDLDKARPTKRVTQGVGTQIGIIELDPVAGTDTEGIIDINSAIVQLIDKKTGQDAGVVVVSVWFGVVNVEGQNTVVDSDGKRWDLQLRSKRYYKPYSVTLIDTSREDYIGTSQVKDYRSIVRIYDPAQKVDIRHHIWMNNPLRYSGETFYQSDHRFMDGRERSVLSVVQNTGWLIPYISCVIVGMGMFAHFWVVLVRFLKRLKPAEQSTGYQSTLEALFPWAMAIMIAMYFFSKSRVPQTTEVVPDLFQFGQVPLIYEGRDQPLDSLARNSMRIFCKKDSFVHVDPKSKGETKIRAIQWMYDLMTDPHKAESHRIFRIDHPKVRAKLKLQQKRKGSCYAKVEFKRAFLKEIYDNDLKQALEVKEKHRTAEQRAVVQFFNKLRHYENLRAALDRTKIIELQPESIYAQLEQAEELQKEELPFIIPPDADVPGGHDGKWLILPLIASANELRAQNGVASFESGRELLQSLELGAVTQQVRRSAYGVESFVAKKKNPRSDDSTLIVFQNASFLYQQLVPSIVRDGEDELARMEFKLENANEKDTAEKITKEQVAEFKKELESRKQALEKLTKQFESTTEALRMAQTDLESHKKFDETVKKLLLDQAQQLHKTADETQQLSNRYLDLYMAKLESSQPKDLDFAMTKFETFYNHFAPFWYATFAYIFAFVLAATGMLGWRKPLHRAAFYVILVTCVLHFFSLGARVMISGRPPVTNLYSSALFIGFGCVVFGIVYEAIYKIGIGSLFASVLGAATLWISTLLVNQGDTFKVLVAVLDTQFWLATHVTCITLGYSATFVAGILGLMHVIKNLFSTTDDSGNKEMIRMIYGTVSFGIFFSFVGTVLGGLWADDSWGRFWGWDPKENGALMIVIWNAMVLHARWDRMVGDRGLAVLAIGGNIVTSWSWFGVNELGVGLHSYGFTKGVWMALWCFWVSQFVIIGLAFVRKKRPATRYGNVEILDE